MAVTNTAKTPLQNIATPIAYGSSYPLPLPSGQINAHMADLYRERAASAPFIPNTF